MSDLPYLGASTRVDMCWLEGAPHQYERWVDESRAAPKVVAKAKWAEAQGYDAMVVSCMVDPGVAEARRVVRMPVIGLGAATRAIAGLIGRSPATFYPAPIPVVALASEPERTYARSVEAARYCIRRGGADVLVAECAHLGRLAHRLQEDLGVPVLPNEDVGLRVAETIAIFGLVREEERVAQEHGPRWVSRLHRACAFLRHRVVSYLPRWRFR